MAKRKRRKFYTKTVTRKCRCGKDYRCGVHESTWYEKRQCTECGLKRHIKRLEVSLKRAQARLTKSAKKVS